jgi:hypothetical protein
VAYIFLSRTMFRLEYYLLGGNDMQSNKSSPMFHRNAPPASSILKDKPVTKLQEGDGRMLVF